MAIYFTRATNIFIINKHWKNEILTFAQHIVLS